MTKDERIGNLEAQLKDEQARRATLASAIHGEDKLRIVNLEAENERLIQGIL